MNRTAKKLPVATPMAWIIKYPFYPLYLVYKAEQVVLSFFLRFLKWITGLVKVLIGEVVTTVCSIPPDLLYFIETSR